MDKKQNNVCSKCGKPVYFAERKTSLGREWHPACLQCEKCNKVLVPGQHAEHKGLPYCHTPCYRALFGPQMVGYGSNVSSPANFRKSSQLDNSLSLDEGQPEGMRCVFNTTDTSPGPMKGFVRNNSGEGIGLQEKHNSSPTISTSGSSGSTGSSGYHSNGSSSGFNSDISGLKCVYESSSDQQKSSILFGNQSSRTTGVARSHSDVGRTDAPWPRSNTQLRGAQLFKRVESYNENHQSKRGQILSLTEENGNVRVQGPLHIYWGLKKPIVLQQYDDKPSVPIPKKRYSVVNNVSDLAALPELQMEDNETEGSTSPWKSGMDDSVLSSPTSEVVMRRSKIKKSNTVAYRGDRPNKWKRASINGHIYNFDTSVFTPVLGSCTSVTVDNKMTVQQVITTLLEKFKVENKPNEYDLCIITEKEGERLLKETDIPLLERLVLGPTDSVKLYIRDRPVTTPPTLQANIPEPGSPEEPPQDIHLPEEVEQLIQIPEPVLRGILKKFRNDEELEVRSLRARYERIRRKVQQIIVDKKANISRC